LTLSLRTSETSVFAKFAFWGFSEVELPIYGVLGSWLVGTEKGAQILQKKSALGVRQC
jgi:hypothetical protein